MLSDAERGHRFARLGQVEDYPWTTGYLVPNMIEAQIYPTEIADQLPEGATASSCYVNAELGQIHRDAFTEAAAAHGIEIVGEQTIDPTDANPPTSQVTTLAEQGADVVIAVPLGAGCIGLLNEVAWRASALSRRIAPGPAVQRGHADVLRDR